MKSWKKRISFIKLVKWISTFIISFLNLSYKNKTVLVFEENRFNVELEQNEQCCGLAFHMI